MDNMAIIHEILFIANFVTCLCYQEHNKFLQEHASSDKTCSGDEIEFEAIASSVISCASKCTMENGCNSFVYHRSSGTCYGIKPTIACSTFVNLQGARFYRSHLLPSTITTTTTKTTSTTTPGLGCSKALLPEVNDYQITASSFNPFFPPHHARLDAGTFWASNTEEQDEYIQVKFGSVRVITAVIIQGSCCYDGWIKTCRFFASTDCVNFNAVLDDKNNPKNFMGTIDRHTHSTAILTTALHAKCFRINPVTWNTWPDLRFELLGCHP